MINSIIEESIKAGIPITCIYTPDGGFVYEVADFYKSGIVTIQEEEGKLIATARYNEKTEICTPGDIVWLNRRWWEYSKDRFDGWSVPPPTWAALYKKFGIS